MSRNSTVFKVQAQINKASMEDKSIDRTKYVCIPEDVYITGDFVRPSSWRIMMATGDYMYFKARDRKKAQELCDLFFGVGKYQVISDKSAKVY